MAGKTYKFDVHIAFELCRMHGCTDIKFSRSDLEVHIQSVAKLYKREDQTNNQHLPSLFYLKKITKCKKTKTPKNQQNAKKRIIPNK